MLALKRFFTFTQGRVAARRYAREQQRLRNGLERGLEKRLTSALNKRVRMVAGMVRRGENPELGDISGPLRAELQAALAAHIKRVFNTVYSYNNSKYKDLDSKADGDASFGFGFGNSPELDNAIQRYLRTRQSYLANMSQSEGRAIISEVLRLREEGFNLPQISSQLTNKFSAVNKRRAAVIARTETHSATGAAQDAYHREVSSSYGIQMKKQWVATADARTRSNHAAMNGTVVEMEEDFLMPDGNRMKHVGDPRGGAANVINCRCVILYVDVDDDVEDSALPDDPDDLDANEDGIKVDSKGRPIGPTQSEFDKSIEGEDIFKVSRQGYRDMTKRFQAAMDGQWSDPDWEDLKGLSIYSSRKASQYGKAATFLSPAASKGEAFAKGVAYLSTIHAEIDALADAFKIPRTRGFVGVRGRSVANMGDAVMGWNKDWVKWYGGYKKGDLETTKWKRGDAKSDRPYGTDDFFDDAIDKMRSTAYHELGHQVHQLSRVRNRLDYRLRPVEQYMKTKRYVRGKGAPTRYGDSNDKEWFAENFAMWAMRREDFCDPDFLTLIEKLLDGDPLD